MFELHNQDTIMESLMLAAPMPVLQAIQDSYLESVLADMHAEDAEIFTEAIPVRKSGKSRYDKKATRRKGSAKRFRDRSRKCATRGTSGRLTTVDCLGTLMSVDGDWKRPDVRSPFMFTRTLRLFPNRNRFMLEFTELWKSARELPSQWNGMFPKQFRKNPFNPS